MFRLLRRARAASLAQVHVHTVEQEVTCAELVTVSEGGKKDAAKAGAPARKPRFAKVGSMVEAKFTVPQSICLERFEDFPQLGRFTLRDEGKSIAIGKVMSLGEA